MKHLEEGMILYHGSYCIVENPDLQKCAKFKDFGQGFYLTTSKEQAKNFAKITATKSKAKGLISAKEQFGYVSSFKVMEDKIKFSMNIITLMAVEQIAKKENKNVEDVLISFMESNTCRMIYDDSTKLWWDGPVAVVQEYKNEMGIIG